MVFIKAATAASTAANTKGSDLISGQYQFLPRQGIITLYALASATGLKATLKVNGIALIDDEDLCMFGTSGTLKKADHQVIQQVVAGGRVEMYFRNTTGAAITCDYILEYTPTK
jgi:hypothetical protein